MNFCFVIDLQERGDMDKNHNRDDLPGTPVPGGWFGAPISRREAIQRGVLGAAGLLLAGKLDYKLLAAEALPAQPLFSRDISMQRS